MKRLFGKKQQENDLSDEKLGQAAGAKKKLPFADVKFSIKKPNFSFKKRDADTKAQLPQDNQPSSTQEAQSELIKRFRQRQSNQMASQENQVVYDNYTPPSVMDMALATTGVNDSGWLDRTGRIGRLRYLSYNLGMSLIIGILGAVVFFIIGLLAPFLESLGFDVILMISMVVNLIMVVANLYYIVIYGVRRLHDLNHTGWLALLYLVPLFNLLFILYLVIAKGNESANQYGLPPAKNQGIHYIGAGVALLYPVAIIGILMAIAIPAYHDYIERSRLAQESVQEQIQNHVIEGNESSMVLSEEESNSNEQETKNTESDSVDEVSITDDTIETQPNTVETAEATNTEVGSTEESHTETENGGDDTNVKADTAIATPSDEKTSSKSSSMPMMTKEEFLEEAKPIYVEREK